MAMFNGISIYTKYKGEGVVNCPLPFKVFAALNSFTCARDADYFLSMGLMNVNFDSISESNIVVGSSQ
jgi:hypothetical protein